MKWNSESSEVKDEKRVVEEGGGRGKERSEERNELDPPSLPLTTDDVPSFLTPDSQREGMKPILDKERNSIEVKKTRNVKRTRKIGKGKPREGGSKEISSQQRDVEPERNEGTRTVFKRCRWRRSCDSKKTRGKVSKRKGEERRRRREREKGKTNMFPPRPVQLTWISSPVFNRAFSFPGRTLKVWAAKKSKNESTRTKVSEGCRSKLARSRERRDRPTHLRSNLAGPGGG